PTGNSTGVKTVFAIKSEAITRNIPITPHVGMFLVIASDFIAKTVFTPVELPVGIVISIVGVPYFLYLLYKAKA
ncbi:iron chelate uptake ABC transporter family permease subunit, partial [Bacillus sp. D-CC]